MEILYHFAMSVDGYIATPSGGVEWLDAFEGEDYGFMDMWASVDCVLMGSKTYEFALAQKEWLAPDKPSWVFTHRDLPVAHESVTLTDAEPAAVVGELEAAGHERGWLLGGGALATSFRDAGLLTHYEIGIVPVVLGEGLPMLAPLDRFESLRSTGAETYDNGVVKVCYELERADEG
ncbi:MAG TPA: dihydrofolate reductase family protein [Thermoanaerobaculia bacterium]|nr:dihydrofolate reductase family protein [Thermoanaerobaculia bacterium]